MPGATRAFPAIAGSIADDNDSLEAASSSFGRHVRRRPRAVLRPSSAEDIVELIRFARERSIPVAPRGQGHSTHGQAQAEGGIVIEMRGLRRVREITPTSALVDAGVLWSDLLERTLPLGLTPPTLTDYMDLTVGGTLSVGGIGGATFRYGAQTDNVIELEVVTGEGRLVRCSPDHEPELFDACRAGLGQFGVIVGARLRLIEAPARVRHYRLIYKDLPSLLAEQQRLGDERVFDQIYGAALPRPDGGSMHLLIATRYLAEGAAPDNASLLSRLSFTDIAAPPNEHSYATHVRRVDAEVDLMKKAELWDVPHPWFDVLLPASAAERFISSAIASEPAAGDVRHGMLLVYPLRRSLLRTPLLRIPDEEHIVLFDILRNAVPPTPEHTAALIERNGRLQRASADVGGKIYPIGSVPMERADWERHYHPLWDQVSQAKRRFDPDRLLTPGQAIF